MLTLSGEDYQSISQSPEALNFSHIKRKKNVKMSSLKKEKIERENNTGRTFVTYLKIRTNLYNTENILKTIRGKKRKSKQKISGKGNTNKHLTTCNFKQ